MKRRALIQASFGLAGLQSLGACASANLHWETSTFNALGTTLSIRAAHHNKDALKTALLAARDVVTHVEDQMSLFRPSSALSQLNRDGELLHPDAGLVRLLMLSQKLAEKSKGAFDVTVQPLWALFASRQKIGRLPTEAEIAQARQRVGWRSLHITPRRIAFGKEGMGVTLNGIAQGYVSDRVRHKLHSLGIRHALINTGEWSSLGHSDDGRDWVLGIADPHQANQLMARLRMSGSCIATSSDEQCTFSADRKYHHIFDPATGYSPQDISSVTISAPTCAQADALTKVLFVAGYAKALDVANQWHVNALVVHKNGQWQASRALHLQHVS